MLRFKQLEITNYGPYYGNHKITFSQKEGVTIIWGDNGFGKTSILNCFRYVMWGSIMGRDGNTTSNICNYVNDKAAGEGEGMRVSLQMEYDNESYVLTRAYERKGGDGKSDRDYEEHIFLQKGSEVLSDDLRMHFLNTTFPERISRFYLFDAELLSEYENLLMVDDANNKIKKSIEDILGLPVLERGAQMLDTVQKNLGEAAVKNSKTEEKTKQDAMLLESFTDKVKGLKDSMSELQSKVDADEKKLGEVKAKQQKYSALHEINTEQEKIEVQLKSKEDNLNETKTDIAKSMESVWKTVLYPAVSLIVENARKRNKELEAKETVAKVSNELTSNVDSLFESGINCPDCGHDITSYVKKSLLDNIAKLSSNKLSPEEEAEHRRLNALILSFSNAKEGDSKKYISNLLDRRNKLQAAIDLLNGKLDDLDKRRKSLKFKISDDELRGLIDEYANLVAAINTGKEEIENTRTEISKVETQIENLKLKIAQNSSRINKKAFSNAQLAKDLYNLFNDAISEYSQKMKESVERDATDLFTHIAHNTSYKSLEINDNYGLKIVKQDGTYVPNRSSGYEQVVAISLIGALHKNTPISGPIVMDSTFQRIDMRHKRSVIDILPSLSEQVIVLAYDGELDRKYAMQSLGEKLVNEKRINNDNEKSWISNTDTAE